MLYYRDLENVILKNTHRDNIDNLIVISGYIGYEPILRLKELPSNIHKTIIYGMYASEGIPEPLHQKILELKKIVPNLDILYSNSRIHSKIYIWKSNTSINKVLIGSANFSVSGLRNDYKETLAELQPDTFKDINEYYERILQYCIPCTDHVNKQELGRKKRILENDQPLIGKRVCRASLLNKNGVVSPLSGLNWCLSNAHVSEGDAYIAISMSYIKLFPELFPPKKYVNGVINEHSKGKSNRENDEVELIWDDGEVMVGLLEGQQINRENGLFYPKQLASSPQKNILGKYLRRRLGVSLDHRITRTDLEKYGRTHIDISLIGDGIFYLDFSNSNLSK